MSFLFALWDARPNQLKDSTVACLCFLLPIIDVLIIWLVSLLIDK